MKLSIIVISILLFVSCVSTPVAVTEVIPEINTPASKVEYTHTHTYNIIAFTGDTSSFQYPIEIVNFFIEEFKSNYNVSGVTFLKGSDVTFNNVKMAIEPYKNVDNIVNIIIYSGHGDSRFLNAYENIVQKDFAQYLDTIITPTIVLINSCYSGNIGGFLKPNSNITLITGSAPNASTSSGGNNGIHLNMLASIIYAIRLGIALDTDKDGDISILELVSEALEITKENIEKHGKGWANFGVFLWGKNDRVVATY